MILAVFLGYTDFISWLQAWLPIIFMGLLVVGLFSVKRMMPRTRPKEIKPDTAPPIAWDDIAGADEAKAELREVVDYLRDPKRFRAIGAQRSPRRPALRPPGTGKTLLAKAVAHESGAVFFSQSAPRSWRCSSGSARPGSASCSAPPASARRRSCSSTSSTPSAATAARTAAPASATRRSTSCSWRWTASTRTHDVVVIAASNLLEKLDTALLRPGRFDRQIFVSPPDVGGRERILEVHSRNKPIGDSVDFALLARQTAGLTGADLANICNEAAIFAARREREHRRDGRLRSPRWSASSPGCSRAARLSDHERQVVAYHEAGHALCGELLPSVDRVHRISIVPRGKALGYTLNLPEEDRYLKTREELIDMMTMLLGGRDRRGARVRLDHDGRQRRPQARRRYRPRDGPRLRDGHRVHLDAGGRRRCSRRPPGG